MQRVWGETYIPLALLSCLRCCACSESPTAPEPEEEHAGQQDRADVGLDSQGADEGEGDVAHYIWDDVRLGEACETLFDDCGAGNLCLANITCGPTEDDWVCEKNESENPDFYRCQRKCSKDAHCDNLDRHCVGIPVGNGESDFANWCVGVCLPREIPDVFTLEECSTRWRNIAERTGSWPPR